MYWGTMKPAPTLKPPKPVATSRRIVVSRKPRRKEKRSPKASSSSSKPLRIPLLRKVVATPNVIPESNTRRSLPILGRSFRPTILLTKSKMPENDKRAQGLSAYGAERKSPAGEKMCKKAAVRANGGLRLGNMIVPRAKSTRTDSRWATWAMTTPTRASRPSKEGNSSSRTPMRSSVPGHTNQSSVSCSPATPKAIARVKPQPQAHSCSYRYPRSATLTK